MFINGFNGHVMSPIRKEECIQVPAHECVSRYPSRYQITIANPTDRDIYPQSSIIVVRNPENPVYPNKCRYWTVSVVPKIFRIELLYETLEQTLAIAQFWLPLMIASQIHFLALAELVPSRSSWQNMTPMWKYQIAGCRVISSHEYRCIKMQPCAMRYLLGCLIYQQTLPRQYHL